MIAGQFLRLSSVLHAPALHAHALHNPADACGWHGIYLATSQVLPRMFLLCLLMPSMLTIRRSCGPACFYLVMFYPDIRKLQSSQSEKWSC